MAPKFVKERPAFIIAQTEDGTRVLARFFEKKDLSTATVIVPDAFSTRIDGVSYKHKEEHYSIHALSKKEGRMVKWTSVMEPERKETHAALVECKPGEFIWPVSLRRYALAGMGNIAPTVSGPTFSIPPFRVDTYHLISGLMAVDSGLALPQVPGWGRSVVNRSTFDLHFYYTFLLGPSAFSSGLHHHATSAARINDVPTGDYMKPTKPLKADHVQLVLEEGRQGFIERLIIGMRDDYAKDSAFYEGMGSFEETIDWTRWMWQRHISDPVAFENAYPKFKELRRPELES